MKNLALTIGGNPITAPKNVPQGGADSAERIIQIGISLFLAAGILIALIYLILAGIQWTTSGGDKQKVEQARAKITYTIIGLIVMLLSFFIINYVFGFFGVEQN